MGSSVSALPILVLLPQWWSSIWKTRDRTPVSDFDRLSHGEVISLLENIDFSKDSKDAVGAPGLFGLRPMVWRVSHDTVVKCLLTNTTHEPYTMDIVSSQTSILVPRVRRHFFWKESLWVFMDYIDGVDLETAWPSLSLWRKLRVVWTVRSYIRQLRRVELHNRDVPGPIDSSGNALRCEGRYFTDDGAGPFASYDDMSSWYNHKLRITIAAERIKTVPPCPPFDASMPLVLTHGDINLRNVRLGTDGTIWLLDWGFSGAYPKWFEYAGIMAYDDGRSTPRSWLRLAPIMAGCYKSQHRFMRRINLALTHYGLDFAPDT